MAPPRPRPSPFDKHTSASATAISSGFHTVLNMGPQPALPGAPPGARNGSSSASGSGGGGEWLRGLKERSGMSTAGAEEPAEAEDDDDDSDDDSRADSPAGAKQGKGAKGKAASKKKSGGGASAETSAEQRKAQNRIAQREFRQRKQQYIRALEGRVELLSSDHDTQVDRLRWALRGLLAENNQLREVLGNLAAFIGEGMIGGPLQKNGMSREELEELILNRSEKTMTEQWQNWPGATECEELRKIRLEASLPPEGLPESLPSKKTAGSSVLGNAKRKASGEALNAQAKRTSTTQGASRDKEQEGSAKTASTSATASPTGDPSGSRMPVQHAAEPSPLGATTGATNGSLASATAPPPYPAQLSNVNLGFGDGQSLGFNGASGPGFWGMTPPAAAGASNADLFRGMTPGGDSDALLASLFGADAMSTFGASIAAPSPSILAAMPAYANSPVSMASGSAAVQQMGPPSVPSASPARVSSAAQPHGSAGASPSLIEAVAEVTSRAMSAVGNGELTDEIERIAAVVRKAAAKRRQQAGGSVAASPAGDAQDGNRMPETSFVGASGRIVGPEELERLGEASAQLAYHMRNFRRNPAYRLPPLLKPSELQQSVPHDPLIDGMPYPGIRDLLIKHQDTLDIENVWLAMMDYSQLHEGDVFSASVWEMHVPFFVRMPQLLDEQTLANTNKWRAERGEPTVTMEQVRQMAAEHAAAGGTPAA